MKVSYCLSILILVTFATQNLSHNPSAEGADLLDATCSKTQYRDLCMATLRKDPRSANSDVKGLDKIVINAGLKYAIVTLSQLQGTLKNTKNNELVGILKTCQAFYQKVITRDLPNSARELTNGALIQAHDSLASAAELVADCHDALEGSTLIGSQFEHRNNVLEQSCVIAVQILETLA